MYTVTVRQAQSKLYHLIDDFSEQHKPILIVGKRRNAVLIAEKDWSSIQETMFLFSIPKMHESIRKGLSTPLSKCSQILK